MIVIWVLVNCFIISHAISLRFYSIRVKRNLVVIQNDGKH